MLQELHEVVKGGHFASNITTKKFDILVIGGQLCLWSC